MGGIFLLLLRADKLRSGNLPVEAEHQRCSDKTHYHISSAVIYHILSHITELDKICVNFGNIDVHTFFIFWKNTTKFCHNFLGLLKFRKCRKLLLTRCATLRVLTSSYRKLLLHNWNNLYNIQIRQNSLSWDYIEIHKIQAKWAWIIIVQWWMSNIWAVWFFCLSYHPSF